MSSLKSGALLMLYSGLSLDGLSRKPQQRVPSYFDQYPAPLQEKAAKKAVVPRALAQRTFPTWNAVAHATRFAPHILRGSFGTN